MAKYIRPTHLEKKKVIRHFAMTWSSSAHIENVSIRKTNNGMRIASMGCNGVILTRNVLPYRLPPPPRPHRRRAWVVPVGQPIHVCIFTEG